MTEHERLIELLKHDSCHSPMLFDPNCKYAIVGLSGRKDIKESPQ